MIAFISEPVQAAIIVGFFNIIAIFVSRWLSSMEHKKTERDVREIKSILNGRAIEP